MKISDNLNKKFLNVSILLSETEKENKFFRQRDPNVIISIAKFLHKEEYKKISFKDLKEYYKLDFEYKKLLFVMIHNIEEKLNGYLVQCIASQNNDFHLQAKNFNLQKQAARIY